MISLQSKSLLRVFSTPQIKIINPPMLSLLYGQALTYICNFAKEAKVEWFYEDLQDLLGLTTCPLTPRQRKKEKRKKKQRRIFFFLFSSVQFSSVQSLIRVRLFATPGTAARQASLSITNSRSLLKLTSIVSHKKCCCLYVNAFSWAFKILK